MIRIPVTRLSRAVLIGTSDYEHNEKFSNLPAVRGNLSGLEKVLCDPASGVFTHANCTVVDSPDSPRSFMRRLGRAAETAEDVLLLYYAGHGVLDRNGDLQLTVRETDPDLYQLEGTAVPFSWIRQTIEDSPAAIRVLILDCCFSGRAIGAMSTDSAVFQQIRISGTYIITSSEANQISRSVPGERYTAFTGELISILSTQPPPGTTLTLDAITRMLRINLARRGLPRPMSRADDTSGDLVLRRQFTKTITPSPRAIRIRTNTQPPRGEGPAPAVGVSDSGNLRPLEPDGSRSSAFLGTSQDPNPGIPSTQLDQRAMLLGQLESHFRTIVRWAWMAALGSVLLSCSALIATGLVLIFQGTYQKDGTLASAIITLVLLTSIAFASTKLLLGAWRRRKRPQAPTEKPSAAQHES
ncbi:caspase, EACC1-associated type [Pseudonocardia acaciae]|uniref:caspase family protein n=1 Tax=Pseudonocardia acaciae TaxID=551276 RepID=UPI0009FEFF80